MPEIAELAPAGGWLRTLALSPDGAYLAAAGEDKMVYLWSTLDWEMARLGSHESWVLTMTFLPDGRHLVTGGFDQNVILWDVSSREKLIARRLAAPVTSLRAGQDAIWAGTERGRLVRLQLPALQEVHSAQPCAGAITDLAVNADGSVLACASGEEKITLWDLQQNRLWEHLKGHTGPVRSVCFDREVLFSGAADRKVLRWAWKDGQSAPIGQHAGTVWQVRAVSGRGILSAGGDKTVRLWQPDGSREQRVGQHGGEVRAVVAGESWVASAGQDCHVRIWSWP